MGLTETELVTRSFNVPTRQFTYQAMFVAPTWAPSFECQKGLCGLCCLTQHPSGVTCIRNLGLNKAVCIFYDDGTKMCRQYFHRPLVCRKYPFAFGVEDGKILISMSLEGPGTNSKADIDTRVVADVLCEESVSELLGSMDCQYQNAAASPKLWKGANHVWPELSGRVQEFFRERTSFPCLQEILQLTVDTVWQATGLEPPKVPPFSVGKAIKQTQGLYIATRADAHHLGLVEVAGSRTKMSLLDDKFRELKRAKVKTPTSFSCIEMDRTARRMLRDYVSFLSNRPFLWLASVKSLKENVPVPISLQRVFGGAFVPVNVGATLVTHRDKLRNLDGDSMREIISFAEGNTHSIFAAPTSPRMHEQ